MTKDEIKKGLECCCNRDFKTACRNCSYLTCPGCNDTLCKDALNLITEQEKEIDALKAENEELTKVVSSKVYDLIDNTKEIADAREVWERQAKIDVLNELKDGYGLYYLSVLGVKERMLAYILNPMIEELQNAED
nr:MAG TPA: hypothetical protein [Caudoviricetes sp.]